MTNTTRLYNKEVQNAFIRNFYLSVIQYFLHHQIDKHKWDKCVASSGLPIIYAYSWYLDVVSPEWNAIVVDDYEIIFPLTCKKKYGIHYLCQPMFAQQLGFFSKREISEKENLDIYKALPAKFLHVDIAFNVTNSFPAIDYKTDHTNFLYINKSYEEIYALYSNDTKRNLKKASKLALKIEKYSISDSINVFKKNVWHKTPGYKARDFKTFEKLCEVVGNNKQCLSLCVTCVNEIFATGVFFISDEKIIFILGASTPKGKKSAAMRFLFDFVIKSYCKKVQFLDFEGSHIESVNYFYKSFGASAKQFTLLKSSRYFLLKKVLNAKQLLLKKG